MSDVPNTSPEAGVDSPSSSITREDLDGVRIEAERIKREIGRVFIGPDQVIEALLVALFASGHILLEGVPGVAKTTLCRTFAQTIDARFRRIQFTPDLLPSDITGTYIPNLETHEFILRKGPIFANIVLADEINRAPAKTQSALLEAMQERQVTIEGVTHRLDEPFVVLATQNPVEQEGVYMLPEAQLDRFLLKVEMKYPSVEQELRVLKTHKQQIAPAQALMTGPFIANGRALVERVHVSEELLRYIVSLARFTRDHPQVSLGASPRASLSLLKASQARALLQGRDYVLPDDIRHLAMSVMAHRVLLHPEAELGGATARDVVRQALDKVRYG
jgi:MoxR-like ATPase